LRLESARDGWPLFTELPRGLVFSETQTVCRQKGSESYGAPTYLRAMLPITIRKGGESTKEEVSVGRERDDEGLQDWEKDRQEEHDEREEVRQEEREDRKQGREDERETRRRRSP
jgi:hypothetical protein